MYMAGTDNSEKTGLAEKEDSCWREVQASSPLRGFS